MVGTRSSNEAGVHELQVDALRHPWRRFWGRTQRRVSAPSLPARLAAHMCRAIAAPRSMIERLRGHEDFDHPGSRALIDIAGRGVDVLHLHNLHGGYFDLELLPQLSASVPVVITLHDAWLMTGHCAHGITCERWRMGCGKCPDLTLYPAVLRDATAYNWKRKQRIAARSVLHVATPSAWLMAQVQASLLAQGLVEGRVIPNGVDLSVFEPGDKLKAREALGLPHDVHILVSVGFSMRVNPFKDFSTLVSSLARLGARPRSKGVIIIVIGDEGAQDRFGDVELRFAGRLSEPAALASYYQAADLYLHPARADTFPSSVLEALACGCPVIGSAVGGVPEQVRSLEGFEAQGCCSPPTGRAYATGQLVPPGSPDALTIAIDRLLGDDVLRAQLAENAGRDARVRFDQTHMLNAYLAWYLELASRNSDSAIREPRRTSVRSAGANQ